jgi:hypothetical protein
VGKEFVPFELVPGGAPVAAIDVPEDPTVAVPSDADPHRDPVTWDDLKRITRDRRRMESLAERGKWLADREADDCAARPAAEDFGRLLAAVIPGRAAARIRAGMLLAELRKSGYNIHFRHCAARVDPPLPPALAARFDALRPAVEDLLTEPDHGADGARGTVGSDDTELDATGVEPGDGPALVGCPPAEEGGGGIPGGVRGNLPGAPGVIHLPPRQAG